MEFLKETRFIERLQFFNGQRLFASDLQGVEAFNREMRWLHNKSLHQPGIGNGFAVSGKKGDREVTIGPGYAIDALGREIVLTQNQVEPVPPVAGDQNGNPALYYLTVSYPEDADLEETETREGACRTSGAVRLKEEPVFCWVRLSENRQPLDARSQQEIASGMKLILALAEVLNCQLEKDLSIAQRLSARPARQPYICCGKDDTSWKLWRIADAPFEFQTATEINTTNKRFQSMIGLGRVLLFTTFILPIGLQAEIDTSDCGFLTAPCYSVSIKGPRRKTLKHEITLAGNQKAAFSIDFIVDGLAQVRPPLPPKQMPNGFGLDVLLMVQLLMSPEGLDQLAASTVFEQSANINVDAELEKLKDEFLDLFKDWDVAWMGVED